MLLAVGDFHLCSDLKQNGDTNFSEGFSETSLQSVFQSWSHNSLNYLKFKVFGQLAMKCWCHLTRIDFHRWNSTPNQSNMNFCILLPDRKIGRKEIKARSRPDLGSEICPRACAARPRAVELSGTSLFVRASVGFSYGAAPGGPAPKKPKYHHISFFFFC